MKDRNSHIKKIPPMSERETIQFYIDGQVPERFRGTYEGIREAILSSYVAKPLEDDDFLGGEFI